MSFKEDLKQKIEENCYYKNGNIYFKVVHRSRTSLNIIEVYPQCIKLTRIFGDQLCEYEESNKETFLKMLRKTSKRIGIINLLCQ